MLPAAKPLIVRMLSNRSGSVALTFGIAVTTLMACVGGAVDFSRWHSAKRATSDSVDAAVLAGARALQLNPANHQAAVNTATAFFQRNIAGKTDLTTNTVTFVTSDQNQAITATGTAKISTALLRFAGISEMTVMSDSGSGFPKAKLQFGGQGGQNLEISLMLDVTGSMCANGEGPCTTSTKLDGLKTAANRLVDMVIPATQNDYYSKMAIVPFSTRVRVGPDGGGGGMMQSLTELSPIWSGWYKDCTQSTGGGGSEAGGNWQCLQYAARQKTAWKIMPCVTDRFTNSGNVYDVTEDEPGSNKWLNAHGGDRMTRSWDSSNQAATTAKGISENDPATNWNYNSNGSCADVANANEIMPLSTDPDALKAKINGLQAYGATAGALGTAWAWYMISPEWEDIWTGTKRPGRYQDLTHLQQNGRPLLRKVAILMTDGVYNTIRGWKGQNQQQVSNYAKQICTNMKLKGIEIFTIGLALNELTVAERTIAEDVLRSCGTDISHFYATLDVAELQVAFQDIAYQLSSIALVR